MSNDKQNPSWIVWGALSGIVGAAITAVFAYFHDKHRVEEINNKFNEIATANKNLKSDLAASEAKVVEIKNILGKEKDVSETPSANISDTHTANAQKLTHAASVS